MAQGGMSIDALIQAAQFLEENGRKLVPATVM